MLLYITNQDNKVKSDDVHELVLKHNVVIDIIVDNYYSAWYPKYRSRFGIVSFCVR